MKKGDWGKGVVAKVDAKLADTRDKEIRFFRIDEFKRNIGRVNDFSSNCGLCHKLKLDIAEVAETIDEAIDVPGVKRREYDRLISRLSIHMRKEHGFYPPFYFSYIYALYGLLGGTSLGYLFWLIIPAYRFEMMGIGISAGLIISYILGNIKDRKIRNTKKIM